MLRGATHFRQAPRYETSLAWTSSAPHSRWHSKEKISPSADFPVFRHGTELIFENRRDVKRRLPMAYGLSWPSRGVLPAALCRDCRGVHTATIPRRDAQSSRMGLSSRTADYRPFRREVGRCDDYFSLMPFKPYSAVFACIWTRCVYVICKSS